ncbi:MAG TPA: glycoside hydrolase family 43 protein [Glaciibacter sp.]|nr:glycoside hydrolase family 43 protein [Glaciibacter sp.]
MSHPSKKRSPSRRALLRAAAGLALVLGLSACAAGSQGPGAAEASETPDPVGAPVIKDDFPDPDVLYADDTYYLYATNGDYQNVQVASSKDLEEWTQLEEDALPEPPKWVIPGKTWAPEVTEITPGNFVMYFTAANYRPTVQCIGVATSTSPTGPFTVQGEAMLVCPAEEGGAIDASTYAENGTTYLLWKNDGNCCGLDTWLYSAPLSPDGLTLAGPAQQIIKQTLPWEGELVEAPTLVKQGPTYYLFYSANTYGDENYAVGYATATSLAGPWTKKEEPFLSTDSEDGLFRGPGGQDVVQGQDGEHRLVFHGWDKDYTYRAVYAEPLEWTPSGPDLRPD